MVAVGVSGRCGQGYDPGDTVKLSVSCARGPTALYEIRLEVEECKVYRCTGMSDEKMCSR